MGFIKSVLQEELENSVKMLEDYQDAVKSRPGGCFVRKRIRGGNYWYLAVREGRKVKFIYKGKKLLSQEVAALEKSKNLRRKHKVLILELKKRIRYLRRALRGKEDV